MILTILITFYLSGVLASFVLDIKLTKTSFKEYEYVLDFEDYCFIATMSLFSWLYYALLIKEEIK